MFHVHYHFSMDDAIQWKSSDIASILQNIRFWLRKNKSNKKNIHDGCVWTYNTFEAWSELFPWLSISQLKRLLKKLVDGGLLIKANHNKDKFNNTVWYSLNESEFTIKQPTRPEIPVVRNRTTDDSKSYDDRTESYGVTYNKQHIINSKLVNNARATEILVLHLVDSIMSEFIEDNLPKKYQRYAKLKAQEFEQRFPNSCSVADGYSYVHQALEHKIGLIGLG